MKKAKTEYTAERVSLGKTGGGPDLPEMSQTSQQISEFMKELSSFSGIPGATASETLIAAPLVSNPGQKPNTPPISKPMEIDTNSGKYILWEVDETDQEFDVNEVTITLPIGVDQATKKVNQSVPADPGISPWVNFPILRTGTN